MANRKLNTPYGQLYRKFLSKEDEIFGLLVWVGVPMTDAYRLVYGSKGSGNSIASMASRKAREPQLQSFFQFLYKAMEMSTGYKYFEFKYFNEE